MYEVFWSREEKKKQQQPKCVICFDVRAPIIYNLENDPVAINPIVLCTATAGPTIDRHIKYYTHLRFVTIPLNNHLLFQINVIRH